MLPLPDLPDSARLLYNLAGAFSTPLFVGAQCSAEIGFSVQAVGRTTASSRVWQAR
jgi:hypothetical protein